MRPNRGVAALICRPIKRPARRDISLSGRSAQEAGHSRDALNIAGVPSWLKSVLVVRHNGLVRARDMVDLALDAHRASGSDLRNVQKIGAEDMLFVNRGGLAV